jgi:aminopeptidase N
MKTLTKQLSLTCTVFGVAVNAIAADAVVYRLPPSIRPVSQTIELRIDPSEPNYTGTTTVELAIAQPTHRIGINQVGLEFSGILLSSTNEERALTETDGEWERSWMSDGRPIKPGDYTLTIQFSGTMSENALGMYRTTFEQNDYVFTQMEAMYARHAFPIFDEPSFKIPYQLVIDAPAGLTVIANTPPQSVITEDDWQRVTFMPTPPLPSYLIAYAIGPLERVAVDSLPVPGHIYVPKGHTEQLGFVLRETPRIVAALEEYFGSPYPYRKLDFVSVPDSAFGAMENPGLITYRNQFLLVGDEVSGEQAVQVLDIIAHEIAHIWYGDVVTMAWWDDLWLNEAFATWMASVIIEDLYPEYETRLHLPQESAFLDDALTNSQPIRAAVRTDGEIFENLNLQLSKGHSLLRMLERYVGRDIWQRAIRVYIQEFAWRNATESDLWGVVSKESGLDISAIAGNYLNQPGFALVSIDSEGAATQKRYVREGLKVDEKLWQIPMSIKYKFDGSVRQAYTLLKGKSGALDIPSGTEWVFPDAGGNGYFRWSIDSTHFYNLVDDIDELDERERIAFLDNTEALLNAGSLSMVDYLSVVNRLLQDPHPLVFLEGLEAIKSIGEEFVDEFNQDVFSAYIDKSIAPRYREMGIHALESDSEVTLQLRPRLVRMLGRFGDDKEMLADAATLAARYLKDPSAVETQMAQAAMRITALHDDGRLYDKYIETYLKSSAVDQKSNILFSIYFVEPEIIARHLEFSLSDDVPTGKALVGLIYFAYILEDHSVLYEWLEDNIDRLVAKIPAMYQVYLPLSLAGSCDQENLDSMTRFFADRGDVYAANLQKAIESEKACIARKEKHLAGFNNFLAQNVGG